MNARLRITLFVAFLLAVVPRLALAQTTTVPTIDEIAEGLAADGIYVDPAAEAPMTAAQEDELRDVITNTSFGPVYIGVVSSGAAGQAGGSGEALFRAVATQVERPGVYALVVGRRLYAGATEGMPFERGEAARIADDAADAASGGSSLALLTDFVQRLDAAAASSGGSDGGGLGFAGILALLGLGVGGFALLRSRKKRRQEQEQLEEVREVAEEDLTTLGNELYDLEPHLQLPSASAEARRDYDTATNAFVSGRQALERAKRPRDLAQVSAILEEGRYAIACARARVEGRPLPEHRSPCFFNPAHGPSVTDMEWTPPGGATRQVPVCQADAARIMAGEQPAAREINVGGYRRPYWEAPTYYGPWAGGYYGRYGGGGMFEGLLLGSILFGGPGFGMGWGGPFGGWGGGWGGGYGGGYGGGDGGGDGGDFGGGGFGDFGGGDFGGGDFGGGDFGGGDF